MFYNFVAETCRPYQYEHRDMMVELQTRKEVALWFVEVKHEIINFRLCLYASRDERKTCFFLFFFVCRRRKTFRNFQ